MIKEIITGKAAKILSSKKLIWCIAFAFPCATMIKFIQTYIYSDWSYLGNLSTLIILNAIAGAIYAIKQKNFSFWKLCIGTGDKITTYAISLIATHVITHFKIDGEPQSVLNYFHIIVMSVFIVNEGSGVLIKVNKIRPGSIPARALKYLSEFDSSTGEPVQPIDEPNAGKP